MTTISSPDTVLVIPFKFSFLRMASFCCQRCLVLLGLRMKFVLIRYCLILTNQKQAMYVNVNASFSFITSVKHALAHRCSLNFTSEAHSNKVNVTSAPRSAPTRLVRKVTLKAAFFGRIQKRICDLRSYGFFNTKRTENDH